MKKSLRNISMWLLVAQAILLTAAEPQLSSELVFPLHDKHNHAPGIVECPNGDLLVSWYRGVKDATKNFLYGKILFSEIVDGTSNSMAFGESAGLHQVYFKGNKKVMPNDPSQPCPQPCGWQLNAVYFDYNTALRVRATSIVGGVPTADVGCSTVNQINYWGASNRQFYSFHPGVAGSLRADGSVQYLSETIAVNVMGALVTRSGGEAVAE